MTDKLRNTSQDTPQVLVDPADLAYDADFPEAARMIIVDAEPAAGTLLVLRDINGIDVKYTFGATCEVPYIIEGQFMRIVGNGSGSAGTGANLAGGSDTSLDDIVVMT